MAASSGTDLPAPVQANVAFDMTQMVFNYNNDGRSVNVRQGIDLDVSQVFPVVGTNLGIAFVFFNKYQTSLWHMNSKFYMMYIQNYINRVLNPKGHPIPFFMQTLDDYPSPDPNNPSIFYRSKKGYTGSKSGFMVKFASGMGRIDDYVNQAWVCLASNFKPGKDSGKIYADWLKNQKVAAYEHERGENGKKKKKSHLELEKDLESRLVNAFAQKTVEYNVPLVKHLTFGQIKEFLVDHCHYTGWHDLPDSNGRAILKRHFKGGLPAWDEIEKAQFN